VGQSAGQEARALSVTVIAMQARNISEGNEALVKSRQSFGCVRWLLWNAGSISNEARALAVSEMRMALWVYQCFPLIFGYITDTHEWTPGFFKAGHRALAMLLFAIIILSLAR